MNRKILISMAVTVGLLITVLLTGFAASSQALGAEQYVAKDYSNLLGMSGFSDTLLNNHFKLYQGYVKNTNLLSGKLSQMLADGKADTAEYAELKRRFGWEFDGMRLHEYYFSNLGGEGMIDESSELYKKIIEEYGSFNDWKKDFISTGSMRGIGWVVLYQDTEEGRLFNTWINEHDVGHLAGVNPLLVMDVFEHAFITDYELDKGAYIKAFFDNINWSMVEKRCK